MEDLRWIYGGFTVDLGKIYGGFMDDLWLIYLSWIYGGLTVDLWRIYDGFMEDLLWRIYGWIFRGFMVDLRRIYGGISRIYGGFMAPDDPEFHQKSLEPQNFTKSYRNPQDHPEFHQKHPRTSQNQKIHPPETLHKKKIHLKCIYIM